MESNYSNRDFEQLIKQNADEYRMFPSEKVWSGINNSLHTRRRWTGFGLAFLLLLTGGAVSWVMTMYPSGKKAQDVAAITPSNSITDASTSSEESIISSVPEKKEPRKLHGILPFSKDPEQTSSAQGEQIISVATDAIAYESHQQIAEAISSSAIPAHNELADRIEKNIAPIQPVRVKHAEPAGTPAVQVMTGNEPLSSPAVTGLTAQEKPAFTANTHPAANLNEPSLTIESVTNSFKRERERKRISWQVFITPTISYRKLGTNKAFNNAAGSGYPFSPALTDVNQAVTHRPDVGLQVGFTGRYPITNSLKVRAGLQLNVNRYDIKAFSYSGEMATIGLNGSRPGNSSVSAYTRYRNYSGYKADWLKNFYYSISVPIGAELKVLGNNKTSFGIAGTIQPTYVITDGAYLISTDYKNYAKVPWLTRNFNMSTGFETFVNFTRGNTQWQIGPQVRYQLLSSFENKYPVKENLFDFGVKIGVSLNQ